MYLIGLTGKIGSGKSTVASLLSCEHEYHEYAFADPLKKICVNLGFDMTNIYGTQDDKRQKNKFWGVSGRRFLQVLGSEVFRDYLPKIMPELNLDKSIWVKLFEKYYTESVSHNVVVSDVRFADEYDAVKALGGIIVHVESNLSTVLTEELTHQSETLSDSLLPTVYLRNNGTYDELKEKVTQLIKLLRSGMLRVPDVVVYM